MPDPKLIYKERLKFEEVEKTRLSYEDLFRVETEEDVDFKEAIERNNIEWTRRLNETRQQAIKEGYDAGLSDGELKARQRIDEQLHHFEATLADIETRLEQTIEDLKPGITSLVFDLADKVIGVPVESEQLKNWLDESLSKIVESFTENEKMEIVVSEQDYETVKVLMDKVQGVKSIKVSYQTELLPGEFKVETPFQTIVNDFTKKLTDLRKAAPLSDWGKS